jgi:hypothetical protein
MSTSKGDEGLGSQLLPQAHSWDTALLMVAAALEYFRLLWSFTVICYTALAAIILLFAFAVLCGMLSGDATSVRSLILAPILFGPALAYTILQIRSEFRSQLRFTIGKEYIGLLTHFFWLREVLGVIGEL